MILPNQTLWRACVNNCSTPHYVCLEHLLKSLPLFTPESLLYLSGFDNKYIFKLLRLIGNHSIG